MDMSEALFLFNPRNRRFLVGRRGRYVPGESSKELTWRHALLVLPALLALGLFPLYVYQQDVRLTRHLEQLNASGRTVAGSAVTCLEARGTVSLDYQYTVPGGNAAYSGRDTLPDPSCAPHAPGTPVSVQYLPDNPAVSRLVGGLVSGNGAVVWILVAAIGFGFTGLTWLNIAITEYRLWLLGLHGVLLTEHIVATRTPGHRAQTYLEASYRFQLPDGRSFEGAERGKFAPTPRDIPLVAAEVRVLFCSPRLYRAL